MRYRVGTFTNLLQLCTHCVLCGPVLNLVYYLSGTGTHTTKFSSVRILHLDHATAVAPVYQNKYNYPRVHKFTTTKFSSTAVGVGTKFSI